MAVKQMKIKVLAADDEYWIRENMKTIIDWEAHSFNFLEPAEDGEYALTVVRKERPDILITDISMPFLCGTDLIKTVCEELPETVCIALSGYSDFEFVRGALVAGAIDYLLKPVSAEDLLGVLEIAVTQLSSHDSLQTDGKTKKCRGGVKEIASQVKDYVDANYAEDISLSSLSKKFHVVDSYLSKMFKDVVGENLMLYISRVRIRRATELIRQGNMRLTEIADLVGYGDYAYFNRVFRKITGMGPREYREIQNTECRKNH
jgi:two-component system response regulator YesN